MKPTVYPCWRYHKDHKPKLIHSEAEFEKLGPGWVNSPLKVGAVSAPIEKVDSPSEASEKVSEIAEEMLRDFAPSKPMKKKR